MSYIRQYCINKLSVKSPNVRFGFLSRIGNGSYFEGNNRVGKYSFFQGEMGYCSYVGDNVIFMGVGIGRYSSISSNVRVINGRHPIKEPYVSSSPVFYSKKTPVGKSFVTKQLYEEYAYVHRDSKTQVCIGNDCWIGYGASIIGGVTIGNGAVVLANATVTKDVPPYAIVGGTPARIVSFRYNEETIEKLLRFKWWNKEESWIKEHADYFCDLEKFLETI